MESKPYGQITIDYRSADKIESKRLLITENLGESPRKYLYYARFSDADVVFKLESSFVDNFVFGVHNRQQ